MNKTRDISPYEFLNALQREFICLEIRSKIYIHKNDKEYFRSLMDKKESAIRALSRKNRLDNILDNGEEYIKIWKEIVPQFGFPDLIYNIVNVSDKQLKFPYKGTALRASDGRIGYSKQVNFEFKEVVVHFSTGASAIIPLDEIERLDHRETDEFFYYYPGNSFHCNLEPEINKTGKLISYDLKDKVATISFKDCVKLLNLPRESISRIL